MVMVKIPSMVKQEAVGKEKGASFGGPHASIDVANSTDASSQMHFSAAKLFENRYPAYFADSNNTRSRAESRFVLTTLILITLAVIGAWIVWDDRYFHTDSDLVYNMGLFGGILLLVTLLYSLRKRVRFLRKAGDLSTWYFVHLIAALAMLLAGNSPWLRSGSWLTLVSAVNRSTRLR